MEKRIAWNKGLTKEDPRVAKYVLSEGSKKMRFKKGHESFKKGKTNEEIYGKEKSKEINKKSSESHKGQVAWNKGKPFLVGEKNPTYGKENKWGRHTEEVKRKLSEFHKGKTYSEETLQKMSKTRKEKIERGDKDIKYYQEGEKNPCWNGGSSFEPYDRNFTESFKNTIRKRDNQICMLCGIHREKLRRALSIHHINYDKLLSIPQNCVSLCLDCHNQTNSNRPHWIKFFQSLLSERYGYQYSENNEIKINLK